jgi:hypothetical protein
MKRTAAQEATYKLLYVACKKRLNQVSLSAPEELHRILDVLNAVKTPAEQWRSSEPALAASADLQKTTNELREAEYGLYLAACRVEKIVPSLQDFEAGEIPDRVVDIMERQQNGEKLAVSA